MTDATHIFIATPCCGVMHVEYVMAMLALRAECVRRGIKSTLSVISNDSLITRARSQLLAKFVADETATHLLFIDSDLGFDHAQPFKLIESGFFFCGGIYPIKNYNVERIAELLKADDPQAIAKSHRYVFIPFVGQKPEMRGDFLKVKYLGTGFMMLTRAAVLKMIEAHPALKFRETHTDIKDGIGYALFDPLIDDDGIYLSEDYAFCKRWNAIGGEVWADMRSVFTHTGQHTWRGDFGAQLKRTTSE